MGADQYKWTLPNGTAGGDSQIYKLQFNGEQTRLAAVFKYHWLRVWYTLCIPELREIMYYLM
jgi:hypothetical protein